MIERCISGRKQREVGARVSQIAAQVSSLGGCNEGSGTQAGEHFFDVLAAAAATARDLTVPWGIAAGATHGVSVIWVCAFAECGYSKLFISNFFMALLWMAKEGMMRQQQLNPYLRCRCHLWRWPSSKAGRNC